MHSDQFLVTVHNSAYIKRPDPSTLALRVKGQQHQTRQQCCHITAVQPQPVATVMQQTLTCTLYSWIRSVKYEDSALTLSLLTGSLQAPCVAVFPSHSLLKLLVWLCSLPIPCSSSLRGCVPFLFPAQAPCVAVFPSYSLLKLLAWLCSLPIPCSSSLRGCVPFLFPAQAPCIAVFPSYSLLKLLVAVFPSYSLLKLLA